jgi:hypothetical protein
MEAGMSQGWLETEAEVTSCKSFHHPGNLRSGSSPGFYGVCFTYKVDGISHEGATDSPVEMQRGDKFSIRYNPEHPEQNNSLESECERPWFQDWLYVSYAVVLGLLLCALVSRYLLHQ